MTELVEITNHEQLVSFVLGETNQNFNIESRESNKLIAAHIAQQTARTLHIVSRHMDAPVYDQQDFLDAVSKLARRSKFSEINILVHDAGPAVKSDHRLIALSQRLSSYIQIRRIHKDYETLNEAFLIADSKAVMHRQFSDQYTATINYKDILRAQALTKLFLEIWEKSEPDPQLRRLHL